jgi:uroporphyrinogen III methyltransferase/synthase
VTRNGLARQATLGRVTLIGAGPGDPELITVRGLRVLEEADVVVYDRLAAPELLAHARPDAELIDVGKRASRHTMPQAEINRMLVDFGRSGKRVARLKGGDPFLFGRGGEEVEALAAAGIPVEVVPGVTAASGASACCGIPLTVRGLSSSVTLVTGHEDPTKGRSDVDWAALARAGGTIVIYMGMGRLEEIASALMAGGMPEDTPAAVVRRATTPEQRIVEAPLGRIAGAVREHGLGPPALVIIGEVARPERRAPWFEVLPLFGRRIVVTRSRKQASVLVGELRLLGADVLELPTIETVLPEDTGPLDAALRALEDYDYVMFTSANAVESVRKRLFALGLDSRSFRNARIAAIGEATAAALLDAGLRADIVPESYTAEGLLEALSPKGVSGKRVLLPRAKEAREVLPEGLRARGATVDVVEAYRTVRPAVEGTARRAFDALVKGEVDLLTFTSSSTVRNLMELVGPDKLKAVLQVPAAAIGPVTAKTARELGFSVVAEPETHTIRALVQAIREHFPRKELSSPVKEEVSA